jgi:hypothetical protein
LEEKFNIMNLDEEVGRQERLEAANEIFEDIVALLSTDRSRNYLLSMTSPEQLNTIFEDLERCFAENEDYEKCKIVLRWKNLWIMK